MTSEDLELLGESELSLLETLDHVLSLGLVVAGEITISVANIELIFVGLNLLVGSTETVYEVLGKRLDRLDQSKQSTGTSSD
ncbi:MAG TPA: gas vesicle protein GvpJ [Blastocatellia bacterium]|nr:gas vesicle protein GvpJ [Blastocatellia bacterium]